MMDAHAVQAAASSDWMVVALWTVPSILWLVYRFGQFLTRQYKPLRHHIRHSIARRSDNRGKERGATHAFCVHVLTALPLLLAAPILAYWMVPGTIIISSGTSSSLWFLELVALALVAINGSVVFWILPHPSRYTSYGVDERTFMRGLAVLHVAALQFTAMPISCLVFLAENACFQMICAIAAPSIYLFTILVCASELMNPKFAWEDQLWAAPFLGSLGYGLKTKSKLTSAFVAADTPKKRLVQVVMFSIFGPVGVVVLVQSTGMLLRLLNPPPELSVPREQELYFVLFTLYLTLIMSSGFFTMGQSMFDAETNEAQHKKMIGAKSSSTTTGLLSKDEQKILVETLLTQLLPIFLLQMGPEWIGTKNFEDFLVKFLLWRGQ